MWERIGCAVRVKEQPYIVLPLSAVWSNKWRLVIDASRGLNPFLQHRHVRLESLADAELAVKPNDWQTKTDFASAYWHIPLAEAHQKYTGVHFRHDDGTTTFWIIKILFLGSRDAVRT